LSVEFVSNCKLSEKVRPQAPNYSICEKNYLSYFCFWYFGERNMVLFYST